MSMSGVRSGWSVKRAGRAGVVRRLTGWRSSSVKPSPPKDASRLSKPKQSASAVPFKQSEPSRCSQQPLLLLRLNLKRATDLNGP